jgi:hypothetical protein
VNRFWPRFIKPLLEVAQPRRIMEVGADFGWNTQHLLAYCRQTGARLDVIDPAPRPELAGVLAQYDREYVYLPYKSLDAIPMAPPPDVALLDGDHNWFTIHAELHLLYGRAAELGAAPPIAVMHDCGWPYARRDMYYDPEGIDGDRRQPYAYRGLEPGRSELFEEGMNYMLANALHEGGPRNGVMTGIEDFLAESALAATLHVLPFFNGLGVILPEARATPQIKALIASFTEAESLLETAKELENAHMRSRVENARLIQYLTRRTDALVRARELLKARGEELAAQRAEIEALRAQASRRRRLLPL